MPTLQELRRSVAAYVHDQEVDGTNGRKASVKQGKQSARKVSGAVKKTPTKRRSAKV